MKLDFLSRREAINTLLYMAEHPGCSRSDVMWYDEETTRILGNTDELSRARFLRIKDFVSYGIASLDEDMRLTLSEIGMELYGVLSKMLEMPDPQFDEI